LVDQTVRSLSVTKGSGVVVETDLQTPDAFLRTDRAVSLAMVLHELCFNAMVHGLRDRGVLTIRSRPSPSAGIVIDVEDDGGGAAVARLPRYKFHFGLTNLSPPSYNKGIGLGVVPALVLGLSIAVLGLARKSRCRRQPAIGVSSSKTTRSSVWGCARYWKSWDT